VPGLHLYDPRRSSTRFVYSIAAGVIAWFATATLGLSWLTRALLVGDIAGLTLLAFASWIIISTNSDETRKHAASEDPGRKIVWFVVLAVSAFALFAATFVLTRDRALQGRESTLVLVLLLATTIASWLLTHTAFTFRYAHQFYRGGPDDEGGIQFPHDADDKLEAPDYLDFAYFAFTIGMCFQVSDSAVTDRGIRHTVLAHALLSFAYNTGIIALVLSIVTSRAG
jgi:uncharacterized membrane protein